MVFSTDRNVIDSLTTAAVSTPPFLTSSLPPLPALSTCCFSCADLSTVGQTHTKAVAVLFVVTAAAAAAAAATVAAAAATAASGLVAAACG
jgi:hypothetical protein